MWFLEMVVRFRMGINIVWVRMGCDILDTIENTHIRDFHSDGNKTTQDMRRQVIGSLSLFFTLIDNSSLFEMMLFEFFSLFL